MDDEYNITNTNMEFYGYADIESVKRVGAEKLSIKGNAGRLETPDHVLSYVDISKLEKDSKTGLYKLNSIPFELVLKENLYEPKYSDFTLESIYFKSS